ncbi:hypothetical protein [uncultured Sphingomonas sp.]|uniref:hypothetical protein n=1 Tax=uncultured Sphingomonas sp. TaxID=158754 RepID=UPI0035CA54C1
MILSDALEVAIGLAFIFLMLSLVMTAVNETVETVVKTRGRLLFEGIKDLLFTPATPTANGARGAEDLARVIYSHSLVSGLMRGDLATAIAKRQLPSYIPARSFAQAMVDQALAGAFAPQSETARLPALAPAAERLRLAAERIPNAQLRGALIGAADAAAGDIDKARDYLEAWFANATDRISGVYKRRTQRLIFAVGLVGAVLLNINTLTIGNRLATDSTARRAIAEQAAKLDDPAKIDRPIDRIQGLGLPMGWEAGAQRALLAPVTCPGGCGATVVLGWIEIVAGFLVTALAVSLGAPFWFDVLNRLMVIRATVKPTEKSKDEASQDPQDKATPGPAVVVMPEAGGAAAKPVPVDRGLDTDVFADPGRADERLLEDDLGRPIERDGTLHVAPGVAGAVT